MGLLRRCGIIARKKGGVDIDVLEVADESLREEVALARTALLTHPIYRRLKTLDDLRIYMGNHVFAVWDFMSLVKRLQWDLTTVTVPWVPRLRPEFTRFVNEIVLDEESDQDGQGNYVSHFVLYLEAMQETGADVAPIRQFIDRLGTGDEAADALSEVDIPDSTKAFVRHTLHVARDGESHEVAAAFFYGREDIIPDMFRRMATDPNTADLSPRFLYYLKRHIELDGDHHGPLASQLLASLCGTDTGRWNAALEAALVAIQSRIHLWDGIIRVMG